MDNHKRHGINITKDLLTPNKYSRPQARLSNVTKIAVHYVGNAGSTAIANRNYFESLKAGKKNPNGSFVYASSHYIIGLDGEIIMCVPEDEIAYCTNSANGYSISVENCHPLPDGRFGEQTNSALIDLCADICVRKELNPLTDLIRHYDVTGKKCPLYHVNNPKEWDKLKNSVLAVTDALKGGDEVRYDNISQIPAYARATVTKLIGMSVLSGTQAGKLDLSDDMLRLLVMNDRAGLYENSIRYIMSANTIK